MAACSALILAGCSTDSEDGAPSSTRTSATTTTSAVTSPPPSTAAPSVTEPTTETPTEEITLPAPIETTETPAAEEPTNDYNGVEIDGYPVVIGGPCGNNPGMSVDDITCVGGVWQ